MIQITAYDYLASHNVKPSVQRLAVMKYLMEHRTHPTADEIYQNLVVEMPTLSRTTVYNTLKVLVDNEAVLMLTIDEKKVCYDGDTSSHSHFLCRKCGRVYDLPFISNDDIVTAANDKGHKVETIHLYYKGVCQHCKEKETTE
ncbi:MAG: transcriptional repressor [Bacteroidaceae bacterium]